eukprot:3986175-Prorocentrum_lima.AAC.1
MAEDLVAQLAVLHKTLLNLVTKEQHFQGLRAASRKVPGLTSASRRLLVNVDIAYAVARHLTPASVSYTHLRAHETRRHL